MSETFSVRLTDDLSFTSKDIDRKAEELGLNRSDLVKKALEMMMGFDPVFIERIEIWSKRLNIPAWLVIQNMMIKRFAQDAARQEMDVRPSIMDEFLFREDGVITGEELFNVLKESKIHQLKNKQNNRKQARANQGVVLNGDEAWLDEEDPE